MENKKGMIIGGAIVGVIAVALVFFGNPLNMGFCIACFLRDTSGALGFHGAEAVQYIRPEIVGLILGAFIIALINKEFEPKGGSSPLTRFMLGMTVMVGALMFLGCPVRMILRLAGGDLNAIWGLIGFIIGIGIGILFLNKGCSLKRNYKQTIIEGSIMPVIMLGALIILVASPSFLLLSESGPGSMHAPIAISLIAGLIVGIIGQRTRLCMAGGIRDAIFFKKSYLISGVLAIFIAVLIGNIALGYFNLGFEGQPVAHTDGLWNLLGMVVVGWASVLLGGCPFRQLILAGQGNTDSAITVMGMLVGGAICHNFGLASSPAGPTANGQIGVIVCLLGILIISIYNSELLKSSFSKEKSNEINH